jgi:opacity protein-like surface antigen
MRSKIKINAVMAALLLTSAAGADSLADTIGASKIDGNFRSYFNTRDYDVKTDESALSVGGALRVNTGSINGFNLGLGFYAAQDLGTNSSDAAKVNKRLGSELEVLGEAYVNYTAGDTSVTVGRQKLNTPFANSGDAFIIPFSFEGTSIVYKGISNVILEVDYKIGRAHV